MAVTSDIFATYRGPAPVLRRLLAQGRREDMALTHLLIACILLFVAQSPWQARLAHFDPEVPLQARLYWSGFFWVFVMPLVFYALAALAHVVARMLGGRGSFHAARVATFWALLASTPLWLLAGLVAGLVGSGPQLGLTVGAALAVLAWFWLRGLIVAETPEAAP